MTVQTHQQATQQIIAPRRRSLSLRNGPWQGWIQHRTIARKTSEHKRQIPLRSWETEMKAYQNLITVLVLVATTRISLAAEANTAQDLHQAVHTNDRTKVKALLEAHPTLIDAKKEGGSSPLHSAAYWWRPEIALLLVGKGADINAKDNFGRTPLHAAAGSPSSNASFIVELLIVAGADVRAQDENGDMPLHLAADRGLKARVQLLRFAGLEIKNKYGDTPLTKAVLGWHIDTDIVDFMLATGAKANIFSATQLGQTEAVKALLKENSELAKSKSSRGTTPLHIAAKYGFKDIVEMLLLNGADVHAPDPFHYMASPLGLARDKDVKELLRRHGATEELGTLPKPTTQ